MTYRDLDETYYARFVRLIPPGENGNQAEWKNAMREHRDDFIRRLEAQTGFTLTEETKNRWWKV